MICLVILLFVQILKLGRIVAFLSKALEPPPEQAVQNALEVLTQLVGGQGKQGRRVPPHHDHHH